MPSVKQPIFAAALVLALPGCTELELARFAPPGLIKYEEIAGDRPPNPAIQDRIEDRKIDVDAEYPVLARTPGEGDRPELPPAQERAAEIEALTAARAQLLSAADADREAAEAEQATEDFLPGQRDALKEQMDRDAAAITREQENQKPEGAVTPD